MSTFSAVVVVAASKAVTPVAFTIDTFEPKNADAIRVYLENLDGAQTLNAWVETRAKYNAGSWCRLGTTALDSIGPTEARDSDPISIRGVGEVRIRGTSSGAGLTATYSRRNLYDGKVSA